MDLRDHVEQQMGRRIPDHVWAFLEKAESVEAVRSGRRDVNWLTELAWDQLGNKGREAAPASDAHRHSDAYQRTISELLALKAGQDEEVKAFRADVLNGRLLELSQVPDWIEHQRTADGPATHYVTIPLPQSASFTMNQQGELTITPPLVIDVKHPASEFGLSIERLTTWFLTPHGCIACRPPMAECSTDFGNWAPILPE